MTLPTLKSHASAGEAIRVLNDEQSAILLLSLVTDGSRNEKENQEIVSESIQIILDEYKDVFEEPNELSLKQTYDHKIELMSGASIINIWPYHYMHAQKREIEWLVKEMLDFRVIRSSNGIFSSPVLLVNKNDESWRFCIYYRTLNDVTFKDNHPIPIIDELMDELCRVTYFSKLDLRASYHQIKMT